MDDQIPIARPTLGPSEERAVVETLRSGWVGQGPATARFEEGLRDVTGAREAVATSSGTAALHLSLLAAGIGQGAEVLVPASSFVATANAVRLAGARPVFVDVDLRTFNMDPEDTPRRITPATRAVLVAHQLGTPADLSAFEELCAERGLLLIEDAACALGSEWRGEAIGKPHGVAAVFSFHPRKVITTGEGGAITTASQELAERLRRLRNHGANVAGGQITFPELGYNYRMDDLSGAVGCAQLERLPELLRRRAHLASVYLAAFRGVEALVLPAVPAGATSNWQAFQLLLSDACPLSPREVGERLGEQGIATRPGLTALHRLPLYRGRHGEPLPRAERIEDRGLFLPLYPGMTDAQANRVAEALLEVVRP